VRDKEPDYIPRSIRLADTFVVLAGFFHNIVSAFHILAEEILDLATYNAIRKTQVSKAWEEFSQDLEKMEDNNG
jgi:hypothetical protein